MGGPQDASKLDRVCSAVCWQPTGLVGSAGPGLGLYAGNLHVLMGSVGCMLATYSVGGPQDASKLSGFVVLYVGNLQRGRSPGCLQILDRVCSAVCWQPTGRTGSVGPGLGLYVGNLGLMCSVVPGLGLYVGNLQRGRSPGCSRNWTGFVVLYVGNLQRGRSPWMPQNCPGL